VVCYQHAPHMHPPTSAPFKTERLYAKIVPMGSQSTGTIHPIRKEESIG